MDESVVFVGTFRVPDAEAWGAAIARMTEFVRVNVPGVNSFRAYADKDGNGTVVYVHPNAASLDQHLAAAASLIEEGTAMVEAVHVTLLGAPHPATVERLRASGTSVAVQSQVSGFER
jgi:hypothetical protein